MRQPLAQYLQGDTTFQASQGSASTKMHTMSEGAVAIGRTLDVELIRICKLGFISISRAIRHQDESAFGDMHPADLDLSESSAEKRLDGSIVAQDLLDRVRNEFGMLAHRLPVLRVAEQKAQPIAKHMRSRFVAGDERSHQNINNLVIG